MVRFGRLIRVAIALGAASIAAAQPGPGRATALRAIEERTQRFGEISIRIWEWAEVGYKEVKSAALLKEELRGAGFAIEDNIGGIPTAFRASWGKGKPVIGLLGEYDALPEMSQEAAPAQKPVAAGQPGHGCGHNLLGAGAALAAIAVKEQLAASGRPGTVVFFGAPAEEGGAGKVFMARAGAFQRCDAILTWHPGAANRVSLGTSLANISARFAFTGKAAHAAAAPERGRSALDGLLLMAHCVEMLREHAPQETRIHYVITNGGGAPNVVPAFAEGYFYARQTKMDALDDVWERIGACARAGALGAGVRVEEKISAAVYNVLSNRPLAEALQKNLSALGGFSYTAEERAFAEQLRATLSAPEPLDGAGKVQPLGEEPASASTDVGDVSWLAPTAQFTTATAVPGTPGHSWQNVACSGSSIGRKGMVLASKTLALTALDLYDSPATLAAAKADFERARGGREYRSRIPADAKPPLDYRDRKTQ